MEYLVRIELANNSLQIYFAKVYITWGGLV